MTRNAPQAAEKRMRRLEKQLATLSAALGPAATAALESLETSSAASGGLLRRFAGHRLDFGTNKTRLGC